MRKNKLLLCVVVALVLTMLMAMFVGCNDDGSKTVVTPPAPDKTIDGGSNTEDGGGDPTTGGGIVINNGNGGTADGSTVLLNGVSAQTSFQVTAKGKGDVQVFNGSSLVQGYQVVAAAEEDGLFFVNAPTAGWPSGSKLTLKLYNGAKLVDYPDASELVFTVARPAVSDVQMIDGIRVFDASAQEINVNVTNTDQYGDTYGSVAFNGGMTKGFEKDEIFIIQEADGTQAAFKALADADPTTGGVVLVNFVKPDLSEVFDNFNYNETTVLDADSEIVVEENVEAQLQDSELNMAIVSMFQASPTFDVNVEMVGDKLVATITVTVPDVLVIEGGLRSDLVLTLTNELGVALTADINKDTFTEYFNVYADITNDMTATVSLGANVNINEVRNVQELFEKLYTLANDSQENPTAIKLFKWTLPIANGVASISYDADLVFAFNFSGSIDLQAHANLDYQVGVAYDKDSGLDAYATEGEDNGFDTLGISMKGFAELKVGVAQEISFDILAGVLGVGLQAELGNYNRVYGYGESTNLINDQEDAFNGGVYFCGGFYYDVNLTYGLKLGSLLNLDDKADIAAGEIQLYEEGDRYVEVGLVQSVDTVELTSRKSLVPSVYFAEVYDLVTGTVTNEPIDASELVFDGADGKLEFTGNVVEALVNEINDTVTVQYKDFDAVTTTYLFSTAKPMLDVNNTTVDKAKGVVDKTVTITYSGIAAEDITVQGLDSAAYSVTVAGDEATVVLDGKELLKLAEGVHNVTFVVDGYELGYTIDVNGKVGLYDFKSSDKVYEIFTADQVIALLEGSDCAGYTFVVTSDIDLGGATVAPLAQFKGTIDGGDHTISGYVVNSMNGNNAALIAVNNGTIMNLVLDGTVSVELNGKTGQDYAVAGLAAVNNGTISGVTVKGSVAVSSTSLNAFIDINVALVAAVDNSDATDADAEGSVDVTVSFDLLNVTVNAGAIDSDTADADVSISVECVNGSSDPIFTKVAIAD